MGCSTPVYSHVLTDLTENFARNMFYRSLISPSTRKYSVSLVKTMLEMSIKYPIAAGGYKLPSEY
jgi:hypothetical protein